MQKTTLELFIPIADGFAETVGNNCEVVIHDLTHPKHSILYIVNGELTGRKIGDSPGPAFKELIPLVIHNEDSLVNYLYLENGHTFKCTKVLIRDEDQKVIGCFCINIVIDEYLQVKKLIDEFCRTDPIDRFKYPDDSSKEPNDNIPSMVKDIIINTHHDMSINRGVLTKADKIELVTFLEEKGIFSVKGSLEMLADILNVSKFSIYSYLDQIRTEDYE